jgi:transcriptional regulator with XRE-family HTH domain
LADAKALQAALDAFEAGQQLAIEELEARLPELRPGTGRTAWTAQVLRQAESASDSNMLEAIEAELAQLGRLRTFLLRASNEDFLKLERLYDLQLELALLERATRIRIGLTVQSARRRRELTLEQLGRSIGPVSASYVSQIERGRALPSLERAGALDSVLGLPGLVPVDSNTRSISYLLTDLRDRQAEVNEQGTIIANRRRELTSETFLQEFLKPEEIAFELAAPRTGYGRPRATSLRAPAPVALALERWAGPQEPEDAVAIERAAGQPLLREAVNLLADLPPEVQTNAIGLLRNLRDLAIASRPPDEEPEERRLFDPSKLWRRQREYALVADWELPTLLLELVELFAPRTAKLVGDPAQRLSEISDVLRGRVTDPDLIIRGPVLRRAASATLDAWRLGSRAGQTTVSDELVPRHLANWLIEKSAQPVPFVSLRRTLWGYWTSLAPAEALRRPAPPADFIGSPPTSTPQVEWFFDRSTTRSLSSWQFASLDLELKLQTGQQRAAEPWSQALTLWDIDRSELERELYRRRRLRGKHAEPDLPPETRAARLLGAGYQAYVEGRIDEASGIFRSVVERFPDVAGGHNNLGFVLLAGGNFEEALSEFRRARTLGFKDEAILHANIGSCQYMIGMGSGPSLAPFEEALREYQAGLRNPMLGAGGAVLWAIDELRMFQVQVDTAAVYLSVAALGAAWSAFRLERLPLSHQFLQLLRTVEASFESPQEQETFEHSEGRLESLVHERTRQPETEAPN